MKVRSRMHRWVKVRAAERGLAMYALLEEWLVELHGKTPWERPPEASIPEEPS